MKITKRTRIANFYSRMRHLGFRSDEIETLRLAQMTLHRWAERECGDGSNYYVERDETTGKTYNVHTNSGKRYRTPDLETGAWKRVEAVMQARNGRENEGLIAYHQTDPRGCALYLVNHYDLDPEKDEADELNQNYSRGFAVCID